MCSCPWLRCQWPCATGIFTATGVLAIIYTWRLLANELRLEPSGKALLLALFLANGPLMNSVREGNTTHFALLAVTLALFELRRSRDLRAGLLLGVASLFKLPLLIFGAYFVIRKRFRAAAGSAFAIGVALGLSLLVFGLSAHLTWYRQFVASAGENPLAAFNVQSFPALLARLERGGGLCDWDGHPLSLVGRAVASGAALLLYALTAIAATWPRRSATHSAPSRAEFELEFLAVLMLACTTSPLAWSHYYAWCLLPIAFMLAPGTGLMLDTRPRHEPSDIFRSSLRRYRWPGQYAGPWAYSRHPTHCSYLTISSQESQSCYWYSGTADSCV